MTLIEMMQERYGVIFEQRGGRYWYRCPMHNDTAPSANVSLVDNGQLWYCYGCKKGGGPVQFIMEMDQIPEWQARRVWNELNGKLEENDDRTVLLRFIGSLAYHEYLSQRGIREDTARRFGVGYCDSYNRILDEIGCHPDTAYRLGLWDVSDCIVYPFYDNEGVYKIAARSIKEKAYKTSSENAQFFKHGLWGLQTVRGKEIWIFEGYHDAMVARQAGYPAVAVAGTNVKKEMWNELKDFNKLVFCPDGDSAGVRWLESLCNTAPMGVSIDLVVIPNGDPDDEINKYGGLDHLKRWNPFEWWITYKYTPATVSDHIRMLSDSKAVFIRMPELDRSVARQWYKERWADDESLCVIQEDGLASDPDAERVVLANCIYSEYARLEACSILTTDDFTGKLHRRIFEMAKTKISAQLLAVECNIDLSSFADIVNYQIYIQKIADIGRRRKISRVLKEADLSNPSSIIDNIYRVIDKTIVTNGVDLVRIVLEDINARVSDPKIPGIELNTFPLLSKYLLGLQPEKYLLISGNSGQGKTTFACNLLNDVVDDQPSLFFSLEMTDKEIMNKMIAIRSGVPSVKLVTGSLNQDEYDAVRIAVDTFMHGNLEIVSGVNDIHKIVAIAKSHIMRRKVRLIVLDYLQLIRLIGNKDDRWEQLIVISEYMKEIARLGPTVVALSQLNSRGRNNPIADANDQAGSYGIIAPTDYAIAINQKSEDEMAKSGSNFSINISKSRFGWDHVIIDAIFDKGTQRIRETVK